MNLPSLPINILFFLFFLPYACSISFQIPRFDPTATNTVYEGDAEPAVGVIELTNKVNYVCRVGRATHAERVPLWNSRTGKITDFTTHFSFIIDKQDKGAPYTGGIAFFLAPFGCQIPPNSAGGFLGLFNTTTSDFAGNQIVLVEFDPYVNPEWDPPYPHVGINKNSIASAVNTPWNVTLHDADTIDVWIVYNATATNLGVHWSYQTTPASAEETTSLSYQIDLTKILPEWVTVGFSAGTFGSGTRNKIVSWEFNSTLDRKYPGPSPRNHANKMIMIIAILAAVSVVSLIAGMIAAKIQGSCWKGNKKVPVSESGSGPEGETITSINEDDSETGAGSGSIPLSDIVTATNNFSNDRELGKGGSGTVFQGNLTTDSDTAVAVKRISNRSGQGRREYMTEVKVISSLRHPNLVQLKGWCHDKDETTKESDVYSFGVVALEIVTGKKSVDPMGKDCKMGLVEWVWDFYGQGKLLSAVDEKLHLKYDEKQAKRLMIVGLWCAHPDRNERPSIRKAIKFLHFDAELPNLPKKMPVRATPVSSADAVSNTGLLLRLKSLYETEFVKEIVESLYNKLVCAGCNGRIDDGLSCLGAVWHKRCLRCKGCNLSFNDLEFWECGGQPYHKHCYERQCHVCNVCKKPIRENSDGQVEYMEHPFWRQRYCPFHGGDGTPRCCSCERLKPRDTTYYKLDDDRKLCPECRESSIIITDNGLQSIYLEVQNFYKNLNMNVQKIPLRLGSREEINKVLKGENDGSDHQLPVIRAVCLLEEHTVTNYIFWKPRRLCCEVKEIIIWYGLPRLLTGSLLAQQMMSAWLRLEHYPNLSPDVEKGICRYLAHKWMEYIFNSGSSKKWSKFEKKLFKFRKHKIESDCGEALLTAKEAVRKHGLCVTLKTIRNTGKFPSVSTEIKK
ncbi:hypothetical protein M0R45_004948 [Rubus argutus]|uniref:Protein kinase domain-containing protein n=1 Tax=Rubus argutus TaxID=59490 RepID=A0AAW1YLF3_RUBAR